MEIIFQNSSNYVELDVTTKNKYFTMIILTMSVYNVRNKNSPSVPYVHGIVHGRSTHVPGQRFITFQQFFGFGFQIVHAYVRFICTIQTVQQQTTGNADVVHDQVLC